MTQVLLKGLPYHTVHDMVNFVEFKKAGQRESSVRVTMAMTAVI